MNRSRDRFGHLRNFLLVLGACISISQAHAQYQSQISKNPVSTGEALRLLAAEDIRSLLAETSQVTDPYERLNQASLRWIDKPYNKTEILGEGEIGDYDQDAAYRTDEFNCTSYVETVMAFGKTSFRETTPEEYYEKLLPIRYKNGKVNYTSRNHFVEIDWNQNNNKLGILSDITQSMAWARGQIGSSKQTISKKRWYLAKTTSALTLPALKEAELKEKLNELQQEAKDIPDVNSSLAYFKVTNKNNFLPDSGAFKNQIEKLTSQFKAQLENSSVKAAIINIVRKTRIKDGKAFVPPWSPPKRPSPSWVHHQVLLVKVQNEYRVRQASLTYKKVMDQSLEEFLKDMTVAAVVDPSKFQVLGLNIQKINL